MKALRARRDELFMENSALEAQLVAIQGKRAATLGSVRAAASTAELAVRQNTEKMDCSVQEAIHAKHEFYKTQQQQIDQLHQLLAEKNEVFAKENAWLETLRQHASAGGQEWALQISLLKQQLFSMQVVELLCQALVQW